MDPLLRLKGFMLTNLEVMDTMLNQVINHPTDEYAKPVPLSTPHDRYIIASHCIEFSNFFIVDYLRIKAINF